MKHSMIRWRTVAVQSLACACSVTLAACAASSKGTGNGAGQSTAGSTGSTADGGPDGSSGKGAAARGGSAGISAGGVVMGSAAHGGGSGNAGNGSGSEDGGADASCDLGSAGSFATDQSLDLFGQITYFAKGKSLPKGRYRVKYVDGCMKYNAPQDWAVHAYADGSDAFWLVSNTSTDRIMMPPGTVGFMVGSGGFATFDECVAANVKLPAKEFDFAGGKLGVWLQDNPYTDNLAGEGGRNPKWSLTLLGSCALVQ